MKTMTTMKTIIKTLMAILMAPVMLTSCLGDDSNTVDYTEWIEENEAYLSKIEAETNDDGTLAYEKIVPKWCPGVYVLAKWHNDRSLTAGNLVPMDNSTVDVIYQCEYVNEYVLDSSYNNTTWGDSIYRCQPLSNIVGFWTMLTNMHVGDSVTCVIPMNAAYGANSSSSVIPYSTLIYHMKLKNIHAYEIANN